MERVQIRLEPLGKVFTALKGSPLKDVLHESGVEFPCGGNGTCGKCAVRIIEGSVEPDINHKEKLDSLGLDPGWRLACLSRCDDNLVVEVEQFEVIIQVDDTPFDFTPMKGYGVAVDLGTTSLVAQLVDLEKGHILAVETALNPQKSFGNDLISRLEIALSDGPEQLKGMIRDRIGRMITALCRGRCDELSRIVIVGNSVMQHFFCGSDIKPLSFYPFQSPDLGAKNFTAEELDWRVICPDISFMPSIGSFVGSDILAGILATGMHRRDDMSVLIDLGTNGEIVVGNRNQLICASTAAGPAFEGATISSGMLAVTGAIASVRSISIDPSFDVIGGEKPRGICGSGLIDAVAIMLKEGLIGEFGEILSGDTEIMVTSTVSLTQKDIQEFQLAKAAIAAGIEILLDSLGLVSEDISNVYIAGAFGTYINVENVIMTGMLSFGEGLIQQPGNTAMLGARMMLFPEGASTDEIMAITSHLNLESDSRFQDLYVGHMGFTPD